jgi:esterase
LLHLYHKFYEAGTPGQDKASLILIHGLLGSSDNWNTVAEKLKTWFRVYVPDLRNHGRSPHSRFFDYSVLAKDIVELAESHKLVRPHIVGHSMGGKIAMKIAIDELFAAGKIVIEDMAPGKSSSGYKSTMQALLNLDLANISTRREAEELLCTDIPDRKLLLFLLKNLIRDGDGRFSWRANLPVLFQNYGNVWQELDKRRQYADPILFIRGSMSKTITENTLAEIRGYFPRALIETIDGAGHWIHADAVEEFVQSVKNFCLT